MIPSSALAEFLGDLKAHLNITTTKHDAELVDYLLAAYRVAVKVAGHDMYPGTTTELVSVAPVLRHHPVTSVAAVTYLGTDYSSTVKVSAAGVVSGAYTGTSITYNYGQTEPTEDERLGVLIIAANLWETQRSAPVSPLQDGADVTVRPGYGHAVPDRARDLLTASSVGFA